MCVSAYNNLFKLLLPLQKKRTKSCKMSFPLFGCGQSLEGAKQTSDTNSKRDFLVIYVPAMMTDRPTHEIQ
jgi:hypothetical protein